MLGRAYSTFDIKAVNVEQRIIEGIASTPTPDRQDDVMDSAGAQFTLPMPFLWQHGSPIGEVFEAQVHRDGIAIKARISTVAATAPATLRDRIEEAWHSLSARPPLARGLSIGWRPIESKAVVGTKLVRRVKWAWLETSAVVVPANAEATIHTVKQLDLPHQTASRPAEVPPAGVPASARPAGRGTTPMNLQAQIAALTQTKTATADRMATLAGDDIAAMDETATKEYDALVKTADETDLKLSRLEALERAQTISATPIQASTSQMGISARSGFRNYASVTEPELPPGIAFTRAAICKIASRLEYRPAVEIAKERYPSHPSIEQYLKSNIPGGTTTGTGVGSPGQGWGVELLTQNSTFTAGFMDFLRPKTIVGRLNLTRTPFNVRIQSQITGGVANWVGQTVQKPVTFFDFAVDTMGFCKLAAICVLSEELIRFSTPNAETLVRDQIARAIIAKMDTDFIDPEKSATANVSPASITNGITVRTPSGTALANVMTDIQTMVGLFITNNQNLSNLAWIMPDNVALSLSLMLTSLGNPAFPTITVNGGTLAGFPVVTSQYANSISTSPSDGNLVILLNQSEIFLADDGAVTIDASNQASIEMSDNPVTDTGSVVSMYQTNQVAIRAERFINWLRGRASAVEMMGDVKWSA